jgi:hypothetical protein
MTNQEKKANYIGSVEVSFENAANAKSLAKCVTKKALPDPTDYVLVEVNATAGNISFVATDGRKLAAISDDRASILAKPQDGDNVFQALFTVPDWKRICDYGKKKKSAVKFDIYKKDDYACHDTMVTRLGEEHIESVNIGKPYPMWRSVLRTPDSHFAIVPEDVADARTFIKGIKKVRKDQVLKVNVSFYRGSILGYFDYFDDEADVHETMTFRLAEPSQKTIGTCLNFRTLQNVKFTGFDLHHGTHPALIDTEEFDYMMMMPYFCDNGYVFDEEQREVVAEVVNG